MREWLWEEGSHSRALGNTALNVKSPIVINCFPLFLKFLKALPLGNSGFGYWLNGSRDWDCWDPTVMG